MKMTSGLWVVWIAVVASVTIATTNPLYLLLLLGLGVSLLAAGKEDGTGGGSGGQPGIVLSVLLIGMLFGGLTFRYGDTVLLRLPDWPIIGGPLTLEGLLQGLINGLRLATLITLFRAFVQRVPILDLLTLIPPAFADVGMVIILSVNFLPTLARQFQRIREAQLVRGHQPRGLADWRFLLLPLATSSFDRSWEIAQVLTTRAFGSMVSEPLGMTRRLLLIAVMLLGLSGWSVLGTSVTIGWVLLLAAAALLLAVAGSRSGVRADWRRIVPRWRTPQWLVAVLNLAAFLTIVILPPVGLSQSLTYLAVPTIELPLFSGWFAVGLVLLALPVTIAHAAKASRNSAI